MNGGPTKEARERARIADEAQQAAVEAALKADREAALRDVFAAAALSGILACFKDHYNYSSKASRAALAYEYADLMLDARKAAK